MFIGLTRGGEANGHVLSDNENALDDLIGCCSPVKRRHRPPRLLASAVCQPLVFAQWSQSKGAGRSENMDRGEQWVAGCLSSNESMTLPVMWHFWGFAGTPVPFQRLGWRSIFTV